ncbi:hypothetical protein BDN72DRAFT_341457 [Pluteus cervinus]|uniref:Uncharacterized protein n=1 Tax=Pluteus cervinus TaxID=181527 RepID=A0ACD3AAR6_9AGAR|nr:hypothetical protein BDN72DRAFT_341457 [Pluteus cervinus]
MSNQSFEEVASEDIGLPVSGKPQIEVDTIHSRFYLLDGFVELKIGLVEFRAIDFERFLSVLLPRDVGQYDVSFLEEWTSVLHISHKLQCPSVRKLAINQMTPLTSAVDKVVLGHKYDISEWVSEGYIALCQREAPISAEEGHRLGVEDVVHISNIRFQLVSTRDCSLGHLCFGTKRHLLGTNRVLDFIDKTKIPNVYSPSDGDFLVWLAKSDFSRPPLEPLTFKVPDLDTFASDIDSSLSDLAYDTTPELDVQSDITLHHQTISCMPHYATYSFEELRLRDYRKMESSSPPEGAPHHYKSRIVCNSFGGFDTIK